jgi:dTDP-4-dehydrorhamnose 3,5-epimerase
VGNILIKGVIMTPLKIIHTNGGDVFHGMKQTDHGFDGFGEAYFSSVSYKMVKAWKRHSKMTLNIIVPFGEIKFVLFDSRDDAINKDFHEVILSRKNYFRLTIPPQIWVGFQGLSTKENILLNIANLVHDPKEADQKRVDELPYDWRMPI